jgi:hypothetical protein
MDGLARVGVGIISFLYALGFLVVTFHLSQYGVAPVTWLRPQYLLAGIWCLLPVLVLTAGVAFAALQFTEPWIRGSLVVPRKTRRYRHTVGAIQGFGSLFAAFIFISIAISFVVGPSFHDHYRWGPSSIITLKLLAFCLLIAASARYAIAAFSKHTVLASVPTGGPAITSTESDEQKWVSMRFDRSVALTSFGVLMAVACLFFILLYVHSFSVSIYSAMPPTLGGGRPQRVVFLIESGIQQTAPLVVDSTGARSIPYNLLLTTDSSYVVESQATGELAIEFKKDVVRGMIVLR